MIAVTGANGLLGSRIVRTLLDQKHPVVAVIRKGSDTALLRDVMPHIEIRHADVLDIFELDESFRGVQTVVHAAAMVSFNPRRRDEIYAVNVEGTRNVVNAALGTGVQRLIHISSVAALGRQKGQTIIDENNKWIDNPLNSTYAKSKYQSELEVFRGQEEGLNTVIVNPSVILAPADWNKSSAQLFKYVWEQRSFYIDGTLNYVDVRDVAQAVSKLLSHSVQADRIILNAGTIGYIDFFKRVASEFNKRPPSIKLGKTTLKLAAFFDTWRTRLAGGEPLITKETARLANTSFSYQNDKAKKMLGLEFQSIDETVSWCCRHYLSNFLSEK